MNHTQMQAILTTFRQGPEPGLTFAFKKNSNSSRWGGEVITRITGCNDKQATKILTQWLETKMIGTAKFKDKNRNSATGIIVLDQ